MAGASKKPWKELSQEEIDRFYPNVSRQAEALAARAYSAQWQFAKYLFTANTGSGAGLFLLSKSSADPWYLLPFCMFCLGAFCVGVSYFLFAGWSHVVAEGWASDFRVPNPGELSMEQIDERHNKRCASWKFSSVRYFLGVSFLLLMVGGLAAGILFWWKHGLK